MIICAENAMAQSVNVATEKLEAQVSVVADGLEHPWGIAILPDGAMLVTEKTGIMRMIAADGTKSEPISGVPEVDARGQGGLLDVALHPEFAENRFVYISYSEPAADGTNSTAVARGKLSADARQLTDVQVIFSQKPKVASTAHYGSRLIFDRDGLLYITLGERSSEEFRGQSQDLDSHLGKVIRVTEDGAVPPANPFANGTDALPEIWSYGHRNIQGAALHPETGKLWVVEHGPRGGDEINIPQAGKNYGWPIVSHGVNYDGSPVGSGQKSMEGMEPPIYTWTPVIAAGGAMFYSGKMFPEWSGNLFVSGLKVRSLVRLELDGESVTHEERFLTDRGERIRDVAEGLDGSLYVLTDESNGAVVKISRTSAVGG
jgi:glucose/arabinose dehydrogenase